MPTHEHPPTSPGEHQVPLSPAEDEAQLAAESIARRLRQGGMPQAPERPAPITEGAFKDVSLVHYSHTADFHDTKPGAKTYLPRGSRWRELDNELPEVASRRGISINPVAEVAAPSLSDYARDIQGNKVKSIHDMTPEEVEAHTQAIDDKKEEVAREVRGREYKPRLIEGKVEILRGTFKAVAVKLKRQRK